MTRSLRTGNFFVDKTSYAIEYFLVFLQFIFRVDRIHGQYIPCKGSNWWSITEDLAEYVLSRKNWIEENFKHTRSSDEIFVSILVYNSEFNNRRYEISYDCSNTANQRLIDWNRGFPYLFQVEDYEEIISSGLPFVRKTDMNKDNGLVKKLYNHILDSRISD